MEKSTQEVLWSFPDNQPTWRDGIYRVVMEGSKPVLRRWKPSVRLLCEPLWGAKTKKGVWYPSLRRRAELFEDGLDVLRIFGRREDIFELALLRRQVTRIGGHTRIDRPFFELACGANPPLSADEWLELARRMPQKAPIYSACCAMATSATNPQKVIVALLSTSADAKK